MTLAELRTALQARGFNHIDTTQQNRWLNESYQDLCEEAPWPFLEVTTTGVAPLAITDVRTVLSVSDTTQGTVLNGSDRRDIVDSDPGVDDTGTPTHWFLDNTTLRVWPANTTDSLSVRYIKVPATLSADADEPLVPTRYQELIIDGAVWRAYHSSDEHDAAQYLKTHIQEQVLRMRKNLMDRNYAHPGAMLISDLDMWSPV